MPSPDRCTHNKLPGAGACVHATLAVRSSDFNRSRSLLFDAFDLDLERGLHVEAVGLAIVQPEVSAVEAGFGIGAAPPAFEHQLALERV